MQKKQKEKLLDIAGRLLLGTHTFKRETNFYKEFTNNVYITTDDNQKIGGFIYSRACDGRNLTNQLKADKEKSEGKKRENKKTNFVLFLHGKSCERYMTHEYLDLKKALEENVIFLIIDYRGFADNNSRFTKEGANLDILAGMKYLQKEFGATEISVVAHSFGCALALEYNRYIRSIKTNNSFLIPKNIVLLAPFSNIKNIKKDFVIGVLFKLLFKDIDEFLEKSFDYDNIVNSKFVSSLHIIHGNTDVVVKPYHSKLIVKNNNLCKVMFFDEMGHVKILNDERTWNYILNVLNTN
ncbi:hypothetical protein NUSPORA_01211 [Nucleospora cyclopteri]